MRKNKIRETARLNGESRYFDGTACKHGHVSERMTSNARCCECAKMQKRKWASDKYHRDDEYRTSVNHKNMMRGRARRADLSIVEERLAKESAYRNTRYRTNKEFREREKAKHKNRHARRKTVTPPWFERDKVDLVYIMASRLSMEVDHIVPLTSDFVCGLHCWDNLQLLDKRENISKLNRYWVDMPVIDDEITRIAEEFKANELV